MEPRFLNSETVGATGLFTTVKDLAKWIANFVLELHRHGEFPLRYVARNSFATSTSDYWWFDVEFQRDSKETVTGLRLNSLRFRRNTLK